MMDDSEVAFRFRKTDTGDPKSLPPLPENLIIGEDMRALMSELKINGRNILKLLSETSKKSDVYNLFQKYVRGFSGQSCRIAVVGQMKAGKSAFINALVGRADLLPSEVNPCTSVVTRLHFEGIYAPEEAAKFSFFDEQHWSHIAQGGGKLRELVEHFLPGFEITRLTKQLEEMRITAERRLGKQFHDLLGSSHSYDHITPEIMKKYVCAAETWNVEESEADIGRYSDITETADIYLESFPFAYPSIIIDTPGTNDPFFVRDEITFRNLDDADIFIVVLPAQQAFSMTDLALLRILQGLNKDRIIIFINRIDQLDDLDRDTKEIESHVRHVLEREFPSINFPVIIGSARWGQFALKKEVESNDIAIHKLRAYINKQISEDGNDFAVDALNGDQTRSMLFTSSGIPEVAQTISKLMLKGTTHSVGKITFNLHLAIEAILAVLKNRVQKIESAIQEFQVSEGLGAHTDEEMLTLNNDLATVRDLASKNSYYQIQYEKKLENLKQSILDFFRSQLNEVVVQFANNEVQNLLSAVESGQKEKVWRCETLPVRRDLEKEFHSICKSATEQISAVQETAIQELRNLLNQAAPNVNDSFLKLQDTFEREPYLSTLALNHTVALDLQQSWWEEWWSRKRKAEDWAKDLDNLIKTEFFPMVERLVQSAKLELNERVADSVRNFSALNLTIANMLQLRLEELQSHHTRLVQNNELDIEYNNDQKEMLKNYKLQLNWCEERIVFSEDISQKLKRILDYYKKISV